MPAIFCPGRVNVKQLLLSALTLLWIVPSAWAQQDINFTSLTTKNGLSANTVNAILKDRYGLMWFATEDGLDKFDGTSFTIYRNKPDDPKSLQANEILALHEDKTGNLWIGTSGGSLSMYDRKHDAFINFPSGSGSNAISNNVIRSICSDYQGKIWIANFNGVNILDPDTKQISRLYSGNGEPFSKICISIFEDRQHHIWIGTSEGLYEYNPATKEFKAYVNHPGDPGSLIGNIIAGVTQDKKGNIWVGTQQGLSMMKADGKGFINYYHIESAPETLSSNVIRAIAIDADEKLWIGTERGLNIMDAGSGKVTRLIYDYRNVHGLTSEGIRSVYIDDKGIYWLGTIRGGIDKYDKNLNLFNLVLSNPFDTYGLNAPVVTSFAEQPGGKVFVGTEGGGVSLFDPQTKQFRHFNLISAREGADKRLIVMSLQTTRDNRLLIGTLFDGLFILNPGNGTYRQILKETNAGEKNANDIYCIMEDREGNWWIGTNGSGITVMNNNGKVIRRYMSTPLSPSDIKLPINSFIRDILEDSSGFIWIASHGAGMARLNPASGIFQVFNTMNSRLPNDKVQSLLEDRRGNIWAGTFGGGLCLFDKNTGKLTTVTEKDGLQNNTVYKIIEDETGLLWVSTNKGLSSLDPISKKINNYNYYNGIQHNNFFHGSGLLSRNGTLFFGGLEGFNYFNPKYLKKNTNIPSVLITDLKISNQSVTPSKDGVIKENISVASEINLAFKQNFSLGFVGLNYTAPGQNRYAYKLDGFDKDWNYVGSTTVANYTNLDPGNYVFRVKASNNDGVWSTGNTSIKIIVHPPFWRTAYAYILYALFIISLTLYLRHKSIEKIKRKFKLEQEQKEADRVHEIDQLKIKFLTNLSHEFRTPISLILGPVDKLLSQEENVWKEGHLHMIKRNGKRLLNLVNQLLDFRKMEEHELKLQVSDGELISFIKDVFDSFKDLSERKKIEFTFSSNIGCFNACFDHDKIERILFNLLSNAFKFTLEGGKISFSINKLESSIDDQGKTWLLIKVADTGIGIPDDKKNKIFDRFFQHATPSPILNQGTGIGLSITKEFVSMHGGRIEVESEEGKGSSFNIYLPFTCSHISENVNPAPGQLYQENGTITQPVPQNEEALKTDELDKTAMPTVLLVEDNDDFRFYLKENLRSYYRVYEATNGKEGWQKTLSLHPQLIVSDISMPYMDGIELCVKLKSDKRTNHIPVILLTALTGEKDQLKGLETGANDYITKPFNFEVLNSKIKNLLILKDTFKNTYTRKIDMQVPVPEIQPEDEKLLGNLMLYLEENITDSGISVATLSKHLGMSRSTLYNKLFELTGQTPVEYIRSVKLDKAAALLEKSDMNVAQIAYSVGFATPKYFAKSFKAKFNILPSEYMNKVRCARDKKTNE